MLFYMKSQTIQIVHLFLFHFVSGDGIELLIYVEVIFECKTLLKDL